MRTAVVILIALVLGGVFLVQRQHEHQTEAAQAAAKEAATPRPVSEHNWAKHALDTTAKVTRQVAKQREEDGVRK
jgi:uncharacterized protein HemX